MSDNYQEAVECFDDIIRSYSRPIRAWYKKGLVLYNYLAEEDKAINCFKEIIEIRIDSDDADSWHEMGGAYYYLGKYDEAIRCFDKSISINRNHAESWYGRGYSLYELGRYDEHKYNESIECFDEAKRISSDSKSVESLHVRAAALEGKAWVFANTTRSECGVSDIEEAISIEKDLETYNSEDKALKQSLLDTYGFILYNLQKYDDALDLLNKSLAMKPKGKKYGWYHKGNVQVELNKNYDDALRCYDEALKIDHRFAEVYDAKAVVLSYKKNYDRAIEAAKKAIEVKPSLASAHVHLAKLAIGKEDNKSQSFWDFWSASIYRKIVAIILGLFALGIVIYYPLYFGYETVENKEETGNQSKTTISFTKSPKIPETSLIIVGLAIVILLSPEIRKAKLGPIELDLSREPLPAKGL